MTIVASIIIPYWNTPTSLRKLLQTLGNDKEAEILVIDNNSGESAEFVRSEFPFVQLIRNQSNRGYSGACNQGATAAKGEWLVFLNPDVIMSDLQLSEMLDFAKKEKLDAFSPIPEDKNYSKPLPTPFQLLLEFSPVGKLISLDSPKKTLTGGSMFIKKRVLAELMGWDERFFLWFEDSDLTARLFSAGFKIGWYPKSLMHSGGKSLKMLSTEHQKQIFFHSLKSYAKKHFSGLNRTLVWVLSKRFSRKKMLPVLEDGVSLVVPNMRLELLHVFFQENWPVLKSSIENGWLDLVVVSNALKKITLWELRQKYPWVRFIPLTKNQGFAATVNIGFQSSIKKWVGTVNDDTVLTADWIQECLSFVDIHVGSVNPVILGADGSIESAGIHILPKGKAIPQNHLDNGQYFSTDATNGAAVLYSHEALEKVGVFDERFGSYLEDVDLSLRLGKHGYKNAVVTSAQVIHKKHGTSRNFGKYKKYLDAKNWWLVILKNWPLSWWAQHFLEIITERGRNFWGIFKT